MRRLGTLLLGLAVALLVLATAEAGGDKKEGGDKEVKLTGRITCHMCDFDTIKDAAGAPKEKPDGCYTVLLTKKKGKEILYYFDKAGHKKNHGKICKTPMDGTVTGVLSKKGKKNIITVSKVEFKAKE